MHSFNFASENGDFQADSPKGSSPLRVAVSVASPQLSRIQSLLEEGCNVNEIWDPQYFFGLNGVGELPESLTHAQVKISPLLTAVARCELGVVKLLLKFGADPEIRSRLGTTALHEAVKRERDDIVVALIENGADIESIVTDPDGWRSLHLAVASGSIRSTSFLLDNGANITASTTHGWKPFDIALLDRQTALIHLLIQRCPDGIYSLIPKTLDPGTIAADSETATYLLRHGTVGACLQHRELYSGLLVGLLDDVASRQIDYSTAETVGSLVSEFETQLASLAKIPLGDPVDRALCAQCHIFQSQDASSMFDVFHHSDDLPSLIRSVKHGCQLCEMLYGNWNAKNSQSIRYVAHSRKFLKSPSVKLQVFRAGGGVGSNYELWIGCMSMESHIPLRHIEEPISRAISETSQLDIYSATSQRTFATIRAWLEMCNTYESHESCRSVAIDGRPARLIDVGNALSDPILCHSMGSEGSYIALSYCWGSDQNLKTTNANLENHFQGIPFRTIPKTIQDAIITTRELQIRYLWVDSLCIIQDSSEDFIREGSRMHQIYRNAVLTIAVEDSTSCSEGFLHARDWSGAPVLPLDFRVPSAMSTYQRTSPAEKLMANPSVDTRRRSDRSAPKSTHWRAGTSALESRAWTLQEILLSSRVLYCGNSEMRWSCLSGSWSETKPYSHGLVNDDHRRLRCTIFQQVCDDGISMRFNDRYLIWQQLVGEYTRRQLTRPTDRLVAISGLQQIFGIFLDDISVAGMWRHKNFLADLHWESVVSHQSVRTNQERLRCPSWSWVSVDEEISFKHRNIEYSVELVSWDVKVLKDHMKYSGSITLRGLLFRELLGDIIQARLQLEKWGESEHRNKQHGGDFPFAPSKISKDARFPTDRAKVWFLLLGTRHDATAKHSKSSPQALLMCLEKLYEDKLQFRRVGIAKTSEREVYNRYEKWMSSGSLEDVQLF